MLHVHRCGENLCLNKVCELPGGWPIFGRDDVLLHESAIEGKVCIAELGETKFPIPNVIERAHRQIRGRVNGQENAGIHKSATDGHVPGDERKKETKQKRLISGPIENQ